MGSGVLGMPMHTVESQREAYTVTFGDRAENEAGMQIIGTLACRSRTLAACANS